MSDLVTFKLFKKVCRKAKRYIRRISVSIPEDQRRRRKLITAFETINKLERFPIIFDLESKSSTALKLREYIRRECWADPKIRFIFDAYWESLQNLNPFDVFYKYLTLYISGQTQISFDISDYPLHRAVFDRKLVAIHKLCYGEDLQHIYVDINSIDPLGNTPLHLAVKLRLLDETLVLIDHGANPKLRPYNKFPSAIDLAVKSRDKQILKILLMGQYRDMHDKWVDMRQELSEALHGLPDFRMKMCWDCNSRVIPFIKKLAPSDEYTIYKSGQNARVDLTLLAWNSMRAKRGQMSLVYRGDQKRLVLIDKERNTVKEIPAELEQIDLDKLADVRYMQNLMDKKLNSDLLPTNFKIKEVKNWKGDNVYSKINSWDVQKHEIKCTFQTNSKDFTYKSSIDVYRFTTFEEYFNYSITFSNEFLTDIVHTDLNNSKSIKKIKAQAWLCPIFPLQLKYFMPLLSMLTTVSKKAQKLKEFFEASNILNNTGFPVKAVIPVLLTIKATLSFEEIDLQPLSPELFTIPFEPNTRFSMNEDRMSEYNSSMIRYKHHNDELHNVYGCSDESTAKIGDRSSDFYYNCQMTSEEDSIGDAKERFQLLNTSQDSVLITHSENKNSDLRLQLSESLMHIESSSSFTSSSVFLLKQAEDTEMLDSSLSEVRIQGPSWSMPHYRMRGRSVIKQSEVVERVRKYLKREWIRSECNDVDIEL